MFGFHKGRESLCGSNKVTCSMEIAFSWGSVVGLLDIKCTKLEKIFCIQDHLAVFALYIQLLLYLPICKTTTQKTHLIRKNIFIEI